MRSNTIPLMKTKVNIKINREIMETKDSTRVAMPIIQWTKRMITQIKDKYKRIINTLKTMKSFQSKNQISREMTRKILNTKTMEMNTMAIGFKKRNHNIKNIVTKDRQNSLIIGMIIRININMKATIKRKTTMIVTIRKEQR